MSPDPPDPDVEFEPVGPFPSPPRSHTDGEGRQIRFYAAGEDGESDLPAELIEMYVDFDPADRAQGLPPTGEAAIREWLETLFDAGYNVLAWHGEEAVGHATLVPDGRGAYELAIFVHQFYQGAGIGTELLRSLLGHGSDRGVEEVWLTVERWNRPAKHLYEKVGFRAVGEETFEREMHIRLA